MSWRRIHSGIARDQSGIELLRQRHIGRVIGGKIVSKLPNAGQQYKMRISRQTKIQQVLNCLSGAVRGNCAFACQAPQHLRDLNVDQVRRVQGFISR